MPESQNQFISRAVKTERNRLLEFIRRRVDDEDDAEDILQDVFSQLTETVRMMEPIEQVANWLFRVARNRIIDWYRKKKPVYASSFNFTDKEGEKLNTTEMLDVLSRQTEITPEDTYVRNLVWEQLEKALGELPKEQREVFVWHELEDKSFKEISAETGVQVNTLISRKHYAIKHLRERLDTLYDEIINN